MAGIFEINVQEERGFVAVPADIDRLAVVIGCSSEGEGLSPFFLSARSAITELGYGDAVDTLTQIIEQRQSSGGSAAKVPAAFFSTPADTPGSYGTVDETGITGLATVQAGNTAPLGTYEARLKWVTGGVVGTAGMVIRWSLDGGRTYSSAVALGTATSFTIPNSGVKFDFAPSGLNLTALNTLLNELKVDFNAHIATEGMVHGTADTDNEVTAADATDTATRVALANALRAAFSAHRLLTAGGVHGGADTANVVVAPAATDDASALVLALDLKAKYNAHRVLTDGSVHGAADNTNAVTSAAPAAGTFLNAGDVVAVRTVAPQPGATEIAEAFEALADASIDFSLVVLDFDCDAAMAEHITTGLNLLWSRGKRVTALVRTRIPNFESSESEADWGEDIAADWADFTDSRIAVRSAFGLITDAVTSRRYLRSDLAQFAADVVRVERFAWPCAPADRPIPNVSLVDESGVTVGHDEGPRGAFTGLSNDTLGNRFCCAMRLPDPTRREAVFNTVPWVKYASDEKIRNLMTRRLANAMERVAVAAGTPKLGGVVFYQQTGPSAGRLTAASRSALQGSIYQAIRDEFRNEIENADDAALDSGLVQVDPVVTLSGGNLVGVKVRLAPRVGGVSF